MQFAHLALAFEAAPPMTEGVILQEPDASGHAFAAEARSEVSATALSVWLDEGLPDRLAE